MTRLTAVAVSELAPEFFALRSDTIRQRILRGVPASPGICLGTVVHVHTGMRAITDIPEPLTQATARLQTAIQMAQAQLVALIDDVSRRAGADNAAIFKVHAELLRDEPLIATTEHYLRQGHGLAWSWHRAFSEASASLQAQGDPVLAARSADIRDVGQRVLAHITPELADCDVVRALARLPATAVILLADDLCPSDTASLDTTRVCALVTAQGGPYGHTAILARTLGLPAIVAIGQEALQQLKDGQMALLDGSTGMLWPEPDEQNIQVARKKIRDNEHQRQQQARQRQLPAMTQDGTNVGIFANINHPRQAALAIDCGAEGVGLMRTEFLFLARGYSPTEDEQYHTYCAMLDALGDRPLIVRALDIGGDKRTPHLGLVREDNPFLGVRGMRLLLRRPDLFQPQLRALYRTAKTHSAQRLSIMFPMVSVIEEVVQFKRIAEQVRASLNAPQVPLGIMIEVPAAALMARQFAAYVDFFSIGTNDLTQYTLAMDRQNPTLATQADSVHPAVLQMVHAAVQGARQHGRRVGVCGGLAGDPFGAALLVGLGVQDLSMPPRDIAAVKDSLRAQHLEQLQALAQQALSLESVAQVRALKTN